MTGQVGGQGAWLRAAETAAVLGISEKTVRRRAQAGLLTARQVSTGHGPAWEVWLDGVDSRPVTDRAATGQQADSAGHDDQARAVRSPFVSMVRAVLHTVYLVLLLILLAGLSLAVAPVFFLIFTLG
jgi:hypothetical protein